MCREELGKFSQETLKVNSPMRQNNIQELLSNTDSYFGNISAAFQIFKRSTCHRISMHENILTVITIQVKETKQANALRTIFTESITVCGQHLRTEKL